jgi:hypothetical protein
MMDITGQSCTGLPCHAELSARCCATNLKRYCPASSPATAAGTGTEGESKMLFNGFEIHAEPFISKATCKCGHELSRVSNGFFSCAMYCTKCENVYTLKLIKIPAKKINQDFIDQCRNDTRRQQ